MGCRDKDLARTLDFDKEGFVCQKPWEFSWKECTSLHLLTTVTSSKAFVPIKRPQSLDAKLFDQLVIQK